MATTATTSPLTVLIFGASGITGWAIANACTTYPTPTTFRRIIGLTNRPLDRAASLLPVDDTRIELHGGFNLSGPGAADVVVGKLKTIPNIEDVDVVYFAAYTAHGTSFEELKRANVEILQNALGAIGRACPNVKFWTLQTGGKGYGVEFPDKLDLKPPFKESLPRIPKPWYDNIFYYPQYDLMVEASKSAPWTFCEVRPDAIVGFVPQNNAMSIAQGLALFLSFYRWLHGAGATVAFPGSPAAYKSLHTDTSQDILARFHIFASLHPAAVSGQAFNVADNPHALSWADVWPGLCAYFGLKAGGPADEGAEGASIKGYMEGKKNLWAKWEEETGVKNGSLEATTWDFVGFLTGLATFDRQYDLGAIREVGFADEVDTVEGYKIAFERMKRVDIIP